MGNLYAADILAWSEDQAALLRRAAAGEPVDGIDWPNIIEELESVGRSELRACESLLRQAMVHLLKMAAWPASTAIGHWRAETRGFLFEAGQCFSASMAQRINLARLFRSALEQARDEADASGAPCRLPDTCPFTLDALLAGDMPELVAALTKPD